MRVVLDTNIWITYIITAKLDNLVHLIIDNDIQVLTSNHLIEELSEVISRKKFTKYLTLPIAEYIDFHKELSTNISTIPVFTASPDPKDNFLFDLAIQSDAEYIVTGDKRLLDLDTVEGVKLTTLSNFRNMFIQ
jgi:putative PIN family toxin of toxin-antitoxin system